MSDDLSIELRHQADYRFALDFDHGRSPGVVTDLAPPLGANAGPDPEKLLASAVATCLSSSLLFALKKYGNEAPPIRTTATAVLARNESKRMRVGRIDVVIDLGVPAAALKMLERTLATFEEFCVVTQSVRQGIPVNLRVVDGEGAVLAG
jgi:organic hydroperoxide reductase OsmC/OhrA